MITIGMAVRDEPRFGVLGPLTVSADDGSRVALRGNRLPALLTELLFHANRWVPARRLVAVLWGDNPPKSHMSNLHTYIHRLRGRGIPIEQSDGGYRIRVDVTDLDLLTFHAEADAGRRAARVGEYEIAAHHLRRALDQWRGTDACAIDQPHLELEAARLETERICVVEDCVDAELACGKAGQLLGELDTLVRQYPLRERFAAQLMRALAATGRRAEALRVYQRTRHTLVDQLGIEPGRHLREVHEMVLNGQ
ncbi:AfsR/SARP family transcriptional regulator [Kibdelosporangium persicum]|uniref:DNA-binding transcriptional activator of the SARP family n=1 Tax=Kibdelosporangium persicum TaxID=2698649 RepID=A0ABX2FBV5_9PSEU|nr:AfsR/SARP family transcriptional regulator [Kibdelosporangium persicum]NRN68858.1 DNA-binding transcriptional activator of the SARP family [Kibdelosporangium persicum]